MEECCKKHFGEYPHNEDIILHNLFATYDGTYIVKVDLPGGAKQIFEIEGVNGDELVIPKMKLNENMLHKFQVFDQWGSAIIFDDGYADPCDKFSLKTYIGQNIECNPDTCDEDEEETEPYS